MGPEHGASPARFSMARAKSAPGGIEMTLAVGRGEVGFPEITVTKSPTLQAARPTDWQPLACPKFF